MHPNNPAARKFILLLCLLASPFAGISQVIQPCASDEMYALEVAENPRREALRAETEAEIQRILRARHQTTTINSRSRSAATAAKRGNWSALFPHFSSVPPQL